MLFIAGMSFMLLMVFIIGVMVGVHIDAYPEKIAKEVPDIIRRQFYHPVEKLDKTGKEEEKNSRADVENNATAAITASSAAKADDLKGAPAMEAKKAAPGVSAPPSENLKASSDAVNPLSEEDGDAKTVASLPKLKEKDSHKSDTPEKSGAAQKFEGKYMVQLASLKNDEKAKQFCKKITPLGYNPKVQIVELPKRGKWFRVVLDGFETRDEAKMTASALSEKVGGLNCIIRPVR